MVTYSLMYFLFKSYYCLFYGSILWKFNSPEFDKICKSWNIAIRTLLKLLYNTHMSYLGQLNGQLHVRQQCYIRKCRLSNGIVKTCIYNARFT